jgi:hypothetical protein
MSSDPEPKIPTLTYLLVKRPKSPTRVEESTLPTRRGVRELDEGLLHWLICVHVIMFISYVSCITCVLSQPCTRVVAPVNEDLCRGQPVERTECIKNAPLHIKSPYRHPSRTLLAFALTSCYNANDNSSVYHSGYEDLPAGREVRRAGEDAYRSLQVG